MKPKPIITQVAKTSFGDIYRKLLVGDDLDDQQLTKILAIAIFFLNNENANIHKFGYRLILLYADRTKDFRPLFDVSINLGLAPIASAINRTSKKNARLSKTFIHEISTAFLENFKQGENYLTEEQLAVNDFTQSNIAYSTSLVAPTSYGKSELIFTFIRNEPGNICILIPTKALLSQTRRRILAQKIEGVKKLITHPEMYSLNDIRVVAVLTQERLLRLLQKNPKLAFDLAVVDEAHNLLEDESRSILLASSMLVLQKRNPKLVYKFLTPFLEDPNNLLLRHASYTLRNYKVNEYVKTEKIYCSNLMTDKKLKIYDQFLNQFFEIEGKQLPSNPYQFVSDLASGKNIVYFNQPKGVEHFSKSLAATLPPIQSEAIASACKELGSYIHKDYDLLTCMRHGIIYHHGSVPENVRLYIESLYSRCPEFRFIATTSTLLEGVNLPASRMFILNTWKGRGCLSQQQLKNLIGRVCRFNDIFTSENPDLSKLIPEIYVIKSQYSASNANIEAFVSDRLYVEKNLGEKPENVLLSSTEITVKNSQMAKQSTEYIENFEKGTIPDFTERTVGTEVGQFCFNNNLIEIAILENEFVMQVEVDNIRMHKIPAIDNAKDIFGFMAHLFVPYLREDKKGDKFKRFEHPPTQRFYAMFLNWRVNNLSFSQMIAQTIYYWDKVMSEDRDTMVYVGTWGDEKRGGHLAHWTDIRNKSSAERVNLAIVRIKEEMDFLDNTLIKFIETINDLGFIDKIYYSLIKYGTSDPQKISLIKAGFSLFAANVMIDTYMKYFNIDAESGDISADPNLLKIMESRQESAILRLEIAYNLGQ